MVKMNMHTYKKDSNSRKEKVMTKKKKKKKADNSKIADKDFKCVFSVIDIKKQKRC